MVKAKTLEEEQILFVSIVCCVHRQCVNVHVEYSV